MSKSTSEIIDLEDRDPNLLSQHLQVKWDEIFGEPNTIRSPECAWTVSNQCFQMSRNCCYIGLTVLCAPITAFCFGLTFACLSFKHIWCITPCLRIWRISCGATKHFIVAITQAIIIPCTGAFGFFLSQIKVKTQRVTDAAEKQQDEILLV